MIGLTRGNTRSLDDGSLAALVLAWETGSLHRT